MDKQLRYRTLLLISLLVVAIIAAITLSGKKAKEEQDQKSMSLDEYLSETNENWFLTGKNKYTVQAMMVSKEMTFHNDLEVVDLVARDDGETVVLKGTRDEICTIGEDGGPDLSDVWVLNGLIFPDCYDTSHLNGQ